jgi:hypothetical protein
MDGAKSARRRDRPAMSRGQVAEVLILRGVMRRLPPGQILHEAKSIVCNSQVAWEVQQWLDI